MKKGKMTVTVLGIMAAMAASVSVCSASDQSGASDAYYAMTDAEEWDLSGFAQRAYLRYTGGAVKAATEVRPEYLESDDRAFLYYWYQYHINDGRISDAGEYHDISSDDLNAIGVDLFGDWTSNDMNALMDNYVESSDGNGGVYMNSIGDFGDAGELYFDKKSVSLDSDGVTLLVTGKVQIFNRNSGRYDDDFSYTAEYDYTGCTAFNGWKLDCVTIGY
ncbi:MAG: hypothetical protein Q4B01_10395 [Eubacteriales bacterium]|nr:hypothetical protein [Eubacteriales bacterium]